MAGLRGVWLNYPIYSPRSLVSGCDIKTLDIKTVTNYIGTWIVKWFTDRLPDKNKLSFSLDFYQITDAESQ